MPCCKKKQSFCTLHELIEALVTAIEAKDTYTRGHSDRVSELSTLIASRLNLDAESIETIHIAAHLHDIGKIYVPDSILQKTTKLSESEWNQIQLHPSVGCDILKKISGFSYIAEIVLQHHERWDGNGYPIGNAGQTIPLGSRIIAIADAIDAMLSSRPYREPMTWKDCKAQLLQGSGIQFDPMIVPEAIFAYEALYLDQVI